MNIVGAFIGIHSFQIYHMANDAKLKANPVSSVHISGMTRDLQCFAAVVTFNERDHLRSSLRLVDINLSSDNGGIRDNENTPLQRQEFDIYND